MPNIPPIPHKNNHYIYIYIYIERERERERERKKERERERDRERGAKTKSNFKNIFKTPEKFSLVKLLIHYHKLSLLPLLVRP